MKNIIIALVLTLSVLGVNAQGQSYYNGATAKGTNVTYNCKQEGIHVTIANVNNRYDKVEPKRLNGTPIPFDEMITVSNIGVMREIIDEVFTTSAQKWWDDRRHPHIFVTINTNGDVIEVSFGLIKDFQWASIHPDKYYQIEQKLKQRLKFSLTSDQKRQNIVKAIL